ncbi:MAG: hypothetical protein QM785_17950 [Pyrinomonadaceae bacterium]
MPGRFTIDKRPQRPIDYVLSLCEQAQILVSKIIPTIIDRNDVVVLIDGKRILLFFRHRSQMAGGGMGQVNI